MTECTKWHLLFCSSPPPQHSGEMLVSLPLVGQMVAMCCATEAQSCGMTEESNCNEKREAIKNFYQKKKRSKGFGDAMHWLLVINTSGIEANWVEIQLCKRHKGCP
ncbi:hypothetical protein E3U43_010355 [Larimichthys crocea]|uniref:Uncharacterized protein n=1 Tax=Larimichthys crocea TaxID=215358 RepID=A0ACD3REY8_LARCR|nr:hypothetical protein E3U43_010355 [Larimichthys crocea]